MKTIAALTAICLASCAGLPATPSPVTFNTGKNVQATAKNAALSFAAWYLSQLTSAK